MPPEAWLLLLSPFLVYLSLALVFVPGIR